MEVTLKKLVELILLPADVWMQDSHGFAVDQRIHVHEDSHASSIRSVFSVDRSHLVDPMILVGNVLETYINHPQNSHGLHLLLNTHHPDCPVPHLGTAWQTSGGGIICDTRQKHISAFGPRTSDVHSPNSYGL